MPAGFDLFETDPQATHLMFAGPTAIPGGFFNPGSDPFTSGPVAFGGAPLETFQSKGSGDADTVVRRLAPAPLGPTFPDNATIPIEIVALNLVSVEPITVTYNGGQQAEQWQIKVDLPGAQPQGQMNIDQQNATGGTFSSQLPVQPRLTFTRIRDGQQRTITGPVLPYNSSGSPWRAGGCVPPAFRIPGLTDSFCPGLTPGGQKTLTLEQSALAQHGVLPVQP
ncbi:MAG: hypothetical protein EXQ70_10180 [Solirubrobacterales bacterium]|nr:hypothetical protein [Solirubrobacterales bacterium]